MVLRIVTAARRVFGFKDFIAMVQENDTESVASFLADRKNFWEKPEMSEAIEWASRNKNAPMADTLLDYCFKNKPPVARDDEPGGKLYNSWTQTAGRAIRKMFDSHLADERRNPEDYDMDMIAVFIKHGEKMPMRLTEDTVIVDDVMKAGRVDVAKALLKSGSYRAGYDATMLAGMLYKDDTELQDLINGRYDQERAGASLDEVQKQAGILRTAITPKP